jgi:hypothetical protein
VRKHASSASVVQERIRGKGKGKEILYRCEGEVVGPAELDDGMKEEEIVVKDPRKEKGFKKPHPIRSLKTEFVELGYEVSFQVVFLYIFPTIPLVPDTIISLAPFPPSLLYYFSSQKLTTALFSTMNIRLVLLHPSQSSSWVSLL